MVDNATAEGRMWTATRNGRTEPDDLGRLDDPAAGRRVGRHRGGQAGGTESCGADGQGQAAHLRERPVTGRLPEDKAGGQGRDARETPPEPHG